MADVRYMGTGSWSRVLVDDKGKFDKLETVRPGDTVSVSDDEAKVLANPDVPRHLRVFVYAGSEEDKHGGNYQADRYAAVQGNATPYPELDMGSTVVSGRTITRTEDDNPEGFTVAGPNEGPASDNEEGVIRQEAMRKSEEAYQKELSSRREARRSSGGEREDEKPQGERQASATGPDVPTQRREKK